MNAAASGWSSGFDGDSLERHRQDALIRAHDIPEIAFGRQGGNLERVHADGIRPRDSRRRVLEFGILRHLQGLSAPPSGPIVTVGWRNTCFLAFCSTSGASRRTWNLFGKDVTRRRSATS